MKSLVNENSSVSGSPLFKFAPVKKSAQIISSTQPRDRSLPNISAAVTIARSMTETSRHAAELLAAGLRNFSLFAGPAIRPPVASDHQDSYYLLALAETSQAEFLVTGGKKLLFPKQHKSTRIMGRALLL